jgi:hypothetical protein
MIKKKTATPCERRCLIGNLREIIYIRNIQHKRTITKNAESQTAEPVLFPVSRNKRHNRDHPGALDRQGQLSLMAGAIAGNSARHNFAPFRDKITENRGILIIDFYIGIRAKTAKFLSMKKFFLGIPVCFIIVLNGHCLFPFR